MTSERQNDSALRHFVLLLDVTGTDQRMIDSNAQAIHNAYMNEYGAVGAMTMALLRCDRIVDALDVPEDAPTWTHIIHYLGPVQSVKWLQDAITNAAKSSGVRARMQSFSVTDQTDRYSSSAVFA